VKEGARRPLAVGETPAGFGPGPLRQCPKCGEPALIRQEDCDLCTACGYSKCG
jgi:ribonucleoside-diphosphate reductase alpha chain